MPVYRVDAIIVHAHYERGKDIARREHDMKFGKTITIFLIDGEANGRMTCELANWTGNSSTISRLQVKTCADRLDLKTTGGLCCLGTLQTIPRHPGCLSAIQKVSMPGDSAISRSTISGMKRWSLSARLSS